MNETILSPRPQRGQRPDKSATSAVDDLQAVTEQVRVLCKEVEALKVAANGHAQASSAPKFSRDDAMFLVWMTGFTAGANLERDAERGERIFARCREISERLFNHTDGTNPS